ncbi:hypothetical protein B0H12DRAFT_1244312 [Mycena haematopus]|nr:hypothetical protein B0H12DRAFT_1244312 [Mycena haematopus]
MPNSERIYVDLIFRATKKYAAWDPEIPVKVGDYGRITQGSRGLAFWRKNGTFVREGNIYTDGKADTFEVPGPVECGRDSAGETWVTSWNVTHVDLSLSAGGVHPALAQCKAGAVLKSTSGRGAILVMENTMITIIDPPGALRRLLEDTSMRGMVVVSEVHSCSSYARLLTENGGGTVALGLRVEPMPGIATVAANATWVRHGAAGNFKSHVNKKDERTFHPLFRLVSLSEEDTSTGIGPARPALPCVFFIRAAHYASTPCAGAATSTQVTTQRTTTKAPSGDGRGISVENSNACELLRRAAETPHSLPFPIPTHSRSWSDAAAALSLAPPSSLSPPTNSSTCSSTTAPTGCASSRTPWQGGVRLRAASRSV